MGVIVGKSAITIKKEKNQIRRKNYEKNLSTQEKTEEQRVERDLPTNL